MKYAYKFKNSTARGHFDQTKEQIVEAIKKFGAENLKIYECTLVDENVFYMGCRLGRVCRADEFKTGE